MVAFYICVSYAAFYVSIGIFVPSHFCLRKGYKRIFIKKGSNADSAFNNILIFSKLYFCQLILGG